METASQIVEGASNRAFKTSLEEWKHNWQIDVTESANTFKTSLEEWKHGSIEKSHLFTTLLKLP